MESVSAGFVRQIVNVSSARQWARKNPDLEVMNWRVPHESPLFAQGKAGAEKGLERDTGFEPATSSLGSWHSTN